MATHTSVHINGAARETESSNNYHVHPDSVEIIYEDDFTSCMEELSAAIVRGAIIGNTNNLSLPGYQRCKLTEALDGKSLWWLLASQKSTQKHQATNSIIVYMCMYNTDPPFLVF